MKNKVLVWMVILSLLIFSGSLAAKERRGAELEILKKDRTVSKGELIAVKKNSILLLDSRTGADVTINISEVLSIEEKKKSRVWEGLGVGLPIGVVAAVAYPEDQSGFGPDFTPLLFFFAGIIAGGIVGAFLGIDSQILVATMPQEEVEVYLKKLSKKARIPDFQ